MSFDLPDETSRVYRYIRQLDRHVTKLRHKAASRQLVVDFKWFRFIFLLIIPTLAVVIFLIQRTHTRYVLLTGPAGSPTARLAPRLQTILNEPAPIERFLHINVVPDFELRPSCGPHRVCGRPLTRRPSRFNLLLLVSWDDSDNEPSTGTDAKMCVLMLLYKSLLHIVARTSWGSRTSRISRSAPKSISVRTEARPTSSVNGSWTTQI